MNKLEIIGNWNVLKGKLKKRYAHLTKNKLRYVKGKELELLGRIQRKLGKAKREVNAVISKL
jgi:uncharacterized protein YjbJ (UPF0337 family)